jgi:hypothetical protein
MAFNRMSAALSVLISRNFSKNISTRAADVEVFTQPGSLADIATHSRNVRFCHESGYTPKDFELDRIMSDVVRIVERGRIQV